jgi:hypothetical protein
MMVQTGTESPENTGGPALLVSSLVAVGQPPMRVASETQAAHDLGSGLATALVGRVSPRPQNRGRNCTRLGREPLRDAKESARKICGPIIYPHNNCAKADS